MDLKFISYIYAMLHMQMADRGKIMKKTECFSKKADNTQNKAKNANRLKF